MTKNVMCCDFCARELEEPVVEVTLRVRYDHGYWYDFGKWVFCSVGCFYEFRRGPRARNLITMIEHEQNIAQTKLCVCFVDPPRALLEGLVERVIKVQGETQ